VLCTPITLSKRLLPQFSLAIIAVGFAGHQEINAIFDSPAKYPYRVKVKFIDIIYQLLLNLIERPNKLPKRSWIPACAGMTKQTRGKL
jgi:hypothetical protein